MLKTEKQKNYQQVGGWDYLNLGKPIKRNNASDCFIDKKKSSRAYLQVATLER